MIRDPDVKKALQTLTEEFENQEEYLEKKDDEIVHIKPSRILKELPRTYIKHLISIIDTFSRRKYTVAEKQRLIADVLDNLMINFDLTPKQIQRSYEMHRDQKKLKKILDSK